MSIAAVEQYLLNTAKARFGNRLKAVESIEDDWSAETFERVLRATPGLFLVFAGGPRLDTAYGAEIQSRWAWVAVTTHPNNELARRRGDARVIGAYEIIEIVTHLFHEHVVPNAGTMQLVDIDKLFQAPVEKQGATIYGAAFTVPLQLAPADAAPPSLDDFRTFEADYDAAPVDGAIAAHDHVELPQ